MWRNLSAQTTKIGECVETFLQGRDLREPLDRVDSKIPESTPENAKLDESKRLGVEKLFLL